MKKIIVFIILILLIIVFYPKKYSFGIVDPNIKINVPTCLGIKTYNIMPGLTQAICYGILVK